jgi:hypothetical protein
MNENALTKKSTIKIPKTATGKARAGFRKTDGVIMPQAEYHNQLRANGYEVKQTKYGIIISMP